VNQYRRSDKDVYFGTLKGYHMEEKDKVNILLVDDRLENLLALEAILDAPDYNLVRAYSGSQALKHLLVNDFAVILLDVQMPGLDGFETAALIRKRKKSHHIPIIFITAISKDERYVYKGYSIGAVDYIFKPLEPEILLSKVAVFVELFKVNRQVKLQAELLRQIEQRERERKLAELKQKSERRYRNLADAIPQMVWRVSSAEPIEYFNQRWFDYTGLTHEQSHGGAWERILHADDVAPSLNRWQEAMRTRENLTIEARLRSKHGAYRWHLIEVLPERGDDSHIIAWLGTATDIDDQKRIEQALASEKERLVVTLRSISDGVITTDTEGRVLLLNKAAELMTGWTQKQATGNPLTGVFQIRHERTHEPCENPAERTLQTGETVEMDKSFVLIAKDGGERIITATSAPIRNADNQMLGVVLVFGDVTDKQKLEEERLKASKLESIGLLAGAIAHDFNNILTAILGNISLAKIYTQPQETSFERLVEAEKATLWARDLTHQLLTFAKGGAPMKKPAAVAGLIRDVAQFACSGSHVSCEFSLPEELWTVEVDEGQMRQVVHNLIINAQQAMPKGGKVKMSAQNIAVRPEQRKLPLPAGNYVKISCEDNGIGIPPENLSRIFDPYFTTKPKGSGLGLATTYSIIKKHDGLITVDSEVGVGAKFEIYLPASNKPVAKPLPIPKPSSSGHGKILVMDDEAFIRDLLGRLFSHFGYQVEFAHDGAEALALYKKAQEKREPFDVVIMDLVVPGGMGGRETIQKLLEIDPQARVIASSGYSNDPIMADYRKYGFREAVAKPYENEELKNVVQKVMNG